MPGYGSYCWGLLCPGVIGSIFSGGSFNGPQKWWGTNLIAKYIILQKILKQSILLMSTVAVYFFKLLNAFGWQLWLDCRLASLAGLYLPSCVIISPLGDLTLAGGRCTLAGASRATEPQLQWGTASIPSFYWKTKDSSRSCVFRNKILDRVSAFSGKLFPWRKPQFSVEKPHEGIFFEQPQAAVIKIQH